MRRDYFANARKFLSRSLRLGASLLASQGNRGVPCSISLLLAAVGIYGSISFWIKQRTREIGIRMALGAQPRNISALVISHGMAINLVGLARGVAGARALALLSAMLFGVTPADPLAYNFAATLLAAVALAACYFPARRAMDVAPWSRSATNERAHPPAKLPFYLGKLN